MANDEATHSILDLFIPPDAICRGTDAGKGQEPKKGNPPLKGVFGLMCALSADASFVERALRNFTGMTENQRRQSGRCSMALSLDSSHGQFDSIPGLAWGHPVPRDGQARKIELMHAKVALLGFGVSATGEPNYYRLILFTGNWSTSAVNNEINHVWYCDHDCAGGSQGQEAADFYESANFWRALLDLNHGVPGYYKLAEPLRERVEGFLHDLAEKIKPPGRTRFAPRFFSNILQGRAGKTDIFAKDSMGAQVLKRAAADKKRRNFICCGSGFFEDPGEAPEEPEVLKRIVDVLQEKEGGLTRNIDPECKYLVVNAATSGAAGYWFKGKREECCWSFYEPRHPNTNNTALHAKYIFMANWVPKTGQYTSGILYLGSGNLSKQGFTLGPGTGGNVEAGVFLELDGALGHKDLCVKLGIGAQLDPDDIQEPGSENAERGAQKDAPLPPIISCNWNHESRALTWVWEEGASEWESVSLLDVPVAHGQSEIVLKKEQEPSFCIGLKASRGNEETCWKIPVFMKQNGFYTPPPRRKMPDEIMASLVEFPEITPEEDDEDNEDGSRNGVMAGKSIAPDTDLDEERKSLREFPLHLATYLVEIIAQKNQLIREGQMPDWIAHLRRALLEEMDEEVVRKLQSIKLNFLEPLKDTEGFAPPTPVRTSEYVQLIEDISRLWKI